MDEQGGGEGESLEGAGGVRGVDEVDIATRDKLVQWRASQLQRQYGSWTRQQLYNVSQREETVDRTIGCAWEA